MKGRWNNLSERERWLAGAGGALFALALVFQFVVKPVGGWRDAAQTRAAEARQGYEMVVNAAALGAADLTAGVDDATPLRQALTQTAAAAGIDLIRIGAEVDGQIEVQPAAVDSDKLFHWIAALDTRFGVRVAFADINRADDGAVNVQVLIFERKS